MRLLFRRFRNGIVNFRLATVEALNGDGVIRFYCNGPVFGNSTMPLMTRFWALSAFDASALYTSATTRHYHRCRTRGVDNIEGGWVPLYSRGGTRRETASPRIKTTGNNDAGHKVLVVAVRRQFCCCMDRKAAAESRADAVRVFCFPFHKIILRLAANQNWYCY